MKIHVEGQTTTFPAVDEEDHQETVYVAVSKNVKESESVLSWALRNCRGKRICILHVHQPATKIPMMGSKVPISLMEDYQVKKYHEIERQQMYELLDKYIQIGIHAEKLCIEMDSVEKGILYLIVEHGIKWLVMGAAANKSYSRKMKEPKSKKAIRVRFDAPSSCHIWFVYKGNLIYTRESKSDGVINEGESPQLRSTQTIQSLRSHSVAEGEMIQTRARGSTRDYRKVRSCDLRNGSAEANMIWDGMSRRSPSVRSCFSMCSCDEQLENLALTEESIIEIDSAIPQQSNGDCHRSNVASSTTDKSCETMYAEELRRRREIEAEIAIESKDVGKMKFQLEEVLKHLRAAQEQESSMERHVADSDNMLEALEKKMFNAVELLKKTEKERDEMKVELDNALRVAEDQRKKQAEEAPSSSVPPFFSEFSFSEIEEATRGFSQDLEIGVGGYGTVYKGQLRHAQVAIKMLQSDGSQGPIEFQQEVNVLGKTRHPNLVTLVGACPEASALIYEYLPNGSLEDRLNRTNNSPPLSWKTRIRIASELCSALVFLHSCRPQAIVHGDLKPANILLDANFVSKLSDFGICRLLPKHEFSETDTTICCKTGPKGTFVYMDPEFVATGELTTKSDVYSFGIILLRLLTGRPAWGITREVQYALDKENLENLLDPTAGEWPFVLAKELAQLAISCADMNRKRRPNLASDVWKVLESMRNSCGIMSSRDQIPAYFYCPIFKEMMQDPTVAADGYTYEAEAIKGWMDSGHNTSPVTNLPLSHYNLVPNQALRSAIQEWLLQH